MQRLDPPKFLSCPKTTGKKQTNSSSIHFAIPERLFLHHSHICDHTALGGNPKLKFTWAMPFCHLPMSQKPQAWQCSQTHTLQPVLQERAIFELPAVPYQCDIFFPCQSRYHNNSLTLAFFWDDVLQCTSLLLPTTVCDGAGIAPLSTWGQHLSGSVSCRSALLPCLCCPSL